MTRLVVLSSWREVLRRNFNHWHALADFLELDSASREKILKHSRFPLNLPYRLASKMEKNCLDDPLLKQFLPMKEEEASISGFSENPVGDQEARKAAKLLHKYRGRALILCTSACAMHCRYCFRRHFSYEVQEKGFEQEIKAIAEDASISEVILSGGDPLSLSEKRLGALLFEIALIPHVQRLRFHTRFPIGIPERIDENFLSLMKRVQEFLQVYFVIHTNHPRELDEELFARLELLQKLGVVLLNQSVLLKGINDEEETLAQLFESLADHGVLPYYLHQLDRVAGGQHFEVTEERGLELMRALAACLSGYALPRYVKEVAGESGKQIIIHN